MRNLFSELRERQVTVFHENRPKVDKRASLKVQKEMYSDDLQISEHQATVLQMFHRTVAQPFQRINLKNSKYLKWKAEFPFESNPLTDLKVDIQRIFTNLKVLQDDFKINGSTWSPNELQQRLTTLKASGHTSVKNSIISCQTRLCDLKVESEYCLSNFLSSRTLSVHSVNDPETPMHDSIVSQKGEDYTMNAKFFEKNQLFLQNQWENLHTHHDIHRYTDFGNFLQKVIIQPKVTSSGFVPTGIPTLAEVGSEQPMKLDGGIERFQSGPSSSSQGELLIQNPNLHNVHPSELVGCQHIPSLEEFKRTNGTNRTAGPVGLATASVVNLPEGEATAANLGSVPPVGNCGTGPGRSPSSFKYGPPFASLSCNVSPPFVGHRSRTLELAFDQLLFSSLAVLGFYFFCQVICYLSRWVKIPIIPHWCRTERKPTGQLPRPVARVQLDPEPPEVTPQVDCVAASVQPRSGNEVGNEVA